MSWTCFFVARITRAKHAFRRYAMAPCSSAPNRGTHDATVELDIVDWQHEYHGSGTIPSDEEKRDERWPKACACGYVFTDADTWQVRHEQLWTDGKGGEWTMRRMPAGAMWTAEWLKPFGKFNQDQPGWPLVVMTPSGCDWPIDGEPSNGGQWHRTGAPPLITVSPSIAVPGYHGFLRDGVLTDDLEGRKFA